MYIQRVLLLISILLAVFAPALGTWVFSAPAPWYRPFMAWLLIIIVIFASQRANEPAMQKNNRRKPAGGNIEAGQGQPQRRASDTGTRNAV